MFNFIKEKFSSVYSGFTSKIQFLFSGNTIDEATLSELEHILLQADTGISTTRTIMQQLSEKYRSGTITKGEDLKKALESELYEHVSSTTVPENTTIFLLVGVNGSGKTTCAGKLAYHFTQNGKRVLFVAADTFRAAACEQLAEWAHRSGADIVTGLPQQDPGSVVFQGCKKFIDEGYDILIIDTAGRLQTKSNLMQELSKLKRIVSRQLPNNQLCTLLTIDSMLGQNARQQAKLFHESTKIDGIVLTKMDGTAKGGTIFAIHDELKIPVMYVTFGEALKDIEVFSAQNYITQLLETK